MGREELIAALEAATGPSRELDEAIDQLAFENQWRTERFMTPDRTPAYTSSLDDALTLVPEGWCPLIGQNVHHRHWSCLVQRVTDSGDIDSRHNNAPTPAIALCIAAIKARGEPV